MNDAGNHVRLASLRSAMIAAHAQTLLADRCAKAVESPFDLVVRELCPALTVAAVEDGRRQAGVPLSFQEARRFACSVWRTERPQAPPLQVTRQEDLDDEIRRANFNPICAAEARWALPFADRVGLERTGDLAGTFGLVPYIDITDEALNQLSLLHEIGHLLVDTDMTLQGHNQVWAEEFGRLIGTHIDHFTRTEWEVMWEWAGDWAALKVAQGSRWLIDSLE